MDTSERRAPSSFQRKGGGLEDILIGFLFLFPFCEAIHALFMCIADVNPHMHAPLGSFQITSKPATIPVTLYRLSAILTGKSVVIADFSCMTTHNCRDYIKIPRICYERYAAPQTNSLIFKEPKFEVHKKYSMLPQVP